jgi:hypothetical protein
MNRLEQQLNQRLENSGLFKRLIKDVYQRTASLIPVHDIYPSGDLFFKKGFFVGFHDICPWSPSGTKILVHYPESDIKRKSDLDDTLLSCRVGYLDRSSNNDFSFVGMTHAWNWQEGARLQWVNDNELIWNDVRNGALVSVRAELGTKKNECLGPPIHSVSSSGRLATALSFINIGIWSSAYSYLNIDDDSVTRPDCLNIIKLDTHKIHTEICMDEILKYFPCDARESAHHYFSHTSFSPDEDQCAFFHCWLHGRRRFSRLFIKDLESEKLTLISDSNWVSHYCWEGNHSLIFFDEDSNGRRGYRRKDLISELVLKVGQGVLVSDGHPQVSPDRRWLVTDTYPNRFMQQDLIIHDLYSGKRHILARMKIPFRYRYDVRCDFHPRWNRSGSSICFDSAHSGHRSLYILNVEEYLKAVRI